MLLRPRRVHAISLLCMRSRGALRQHPCIGMPRQLQARDGLRAGRCGRQCRPRTCSWWTCRTRPWRPASPRPPARPSPACWTTCKARNPGTPHRRAGVATERGRRPAGKGREAQSRACAASPAGASGARRHPGGTQRMARCVGACPCTPRRPPARRIRRTAGPSSRVCWAAAAQAASACAWASRPSMPPCTFTACARAARRLPCWSSLTRSTRSARTPRRWSRRCAPRGRWCARGLQRTCSLWACCAACACLVGFAGRRWCRSARRPARLQHASLAARRTLPRRSVSNRECAAVCESNYSRSGGAWLWGALVGAVQSRDPA